MTPEEQEILIGELEKDIDRLHALYNQYFMGIEKMEPLVVRKNLDRKIHLLRREQIKNTALRFRLQMQIQKYNTQSSYWSRVCRQIEEGTYNRQIMLAKKRINARHAGDGIMENERVTDVPALRSSIDEDDLGRIDIDISSFNIDLDDPFATKDHFAGLSNLLSRDASASTEVPKGGSLNWVDDPFAAHTSSPPNLKAPLVPNAKVEKRPPPLPSTQQRNDPPKTAPLLDEEQTRSVYRRYLAARQKCNESTDNVSFESVARSLNAKARAEDGKVEFKVVIRDGKALIKTVKPTSPTK